MNLTTILLITTLIPTLLIILTHWTPQMLPDTEKLSPYECGFDPLGNARLPFSLQFFLIAIFFLIFDLEIALLLPLPWAINSTTTTMTTMWTLTIIILLILGLIYEWSQGALDWTKN
uniref:NADH-ubiquinone oxidoreductase chain 3 n=1 Tax=Furcifer oustaleti TaxID=179927 RepID=A1IGS2_FUROU|nr:NADH dehydrogenase subunit 3 [Furcifer oustaleti]BAF44038.1 NADH dehydrogenase subunit 3 [Furcifer oustaleti]